MIHTQTSIEVFIIAIETIRIAELMLSSRKLEQEFFNHWKYKNATFACPLKCTPQCEAHFFHFSE